MAIYSWSISIISISWIGWCLNRPPAEYGYQVWMELEAAIGSYCIHDNDEKESNKLIIFVEQYISQLSLKSAWSSISFEIGL